ncbi:MAG TPA: hypothetical protein VGQ38_17595 [Gaiellaceae bacterium]|jgi:hypothetical protein|nr:hypothetical protein [Gaiellaceae bacterium]
MKLIEPGSPPANQVHGRAFLVRGKADERQIGIVKRQAQRLQEELKCFVTPVICAGVRTKPCVKKDVLIAGRGRVAEAIHGHRGNLPVAAEQLERLRASSAVLSAA